MDPKIVAKALAGTRIAIGLALFVAPARAGRPWIGDAVDDDGTRMATRGLGARDVALGVGMLAALEAGAPVRRWIEAGAAADLGDAAASALSHRGRPAPIVAGSILVAGGAAALGTYLRRVLD